MSRVFITGSADGLGKMAAEKLIRDGHRVVLHARNEQRARDARAAIHGAEEIVTGDLSVIEETKNLAWKVNQLGKFDAVIHNAGMGYREKSRGNSADNLPPLFAVNSIAPYLLTCLINRPQRLIYLSSGLHRQGDASLQDPAWDNRPWNGYQAYCDTKLHDVILAFAVANLWKDVFSNAMEPGWVATKMGGPGAPDNLEQGSITQAWLAVSEDEEVKETGRYFFHQQARSFNPRAADANVQAGFLDACEKITGIKFPES